jgi:hypothetical protein
MIYLIRVNAIRLLHEIVDAGTVLKCLAIAKTKVTDAGVNELQKALPNVKITR